VNCKKVKELLLSYLDNEVTSEERGTIEAHLSACLGCREELEALASVQKELRQAFKDITARASPSLLAWATIKQQLEREEHCRVSVLDLAKSKIEDGLEGLKSRRPVWRVALVTALAVALAFGLYLAVPLLLRQSAEARAESIAMENPGVQVLLVERGFSQPSMVNANAVRSDKGNIYYVYLINAKDDASIGTVTVDVEEGMVTKIGLTEGTEEYIQSPTLPEAITIEAVIEVARRNPEVREILDAGATIGEVSSLSSASEGEVVALELRLGEKSWLLKIDWTQGEVTSVLER
jgi:anti-sigma-K factor RskA